MQIQSILVTGCAGFIGSNFTKQFKDKYPDTEIIGVDDFSTGRKDAVGKEVKLYEGSILDRKFLDNIFDKYKCEYVFHFAALPRVSYSIQYPSETTLVNVDGTVVLLKASADAGVRRFMFSSSSSVYGGARILPTKESENNPDPKSPYAAQKYASEVFCKVYSHLSSMDTVCLRYFNVFGPGQYGDSAYATVISAWLESLYVPNNKKAFIEGDGSQSRDFCYVDNVVLANILAMQSSNRFSGNPVNVANGERTTLLEVKDLIEKYSGKKLDIEHRQPRVGDVAHTHANIALASSFGYKPAISFDEGLRRTVEWFKQRNG